MSVDFDHLAAEAQQSQSQDAMAQLWGAVYALPAWNFVARGALPDVTPFVGVVDGKPMVLAFTDRARADAFARRQGFTDPDGNSSILSLSVQSVVELVPAYQAQGVFGILFNTGSHGFFAPLTNLSRMRRHFAERPA